MPESLENRPPVSTTGSCRLHDRALRETLCRWLVASLLCLSLMTAASPALGHRVLVYAYAEGETIHTESKFVGSGPVQQGPVKVLAQQSGNVLLTGTTDNQGRFSFKVPAEAAAQRVDLLIVVEASLGHRGEWLLKADDYLPGAERAAPSAAAIAPATAPAAPAAAPLDPAMVTIDRQVFEETLNRALERQLAPIKAMLAESRQDRITLTDIIGGIGYILGIFGLLGYFLSRKRQKS